MAFIDKAELNDCWHWLGATNDGGYGTLNWKGKPHRRAHRVSYEIHVGPLAEGVVLRHSCDNPPCVNPGHLVPGSHADNIHDKFERDRDWRGRRVRGERHARSTLTEDAVREIRRMSGAGAGASAIAACLEVPRGTVRGVLEGRTWSWLGDSGTPDLELQNSANGQFRVVQPAAQQQPARQCSIDDCERNHYALGWCEVHYQRFRTHGDPTAFVRAFEDRARHRTCTVSDCEGKHSRRGFCTLHYQRWKRHGDPLKVVTAAGWRPRQA